MMTKPYWPRTMKLRTAAQYCDLSPAAFMREVAVGRLPLPFDFGGEDHWDREALDRDVARIGGELNDWRKDCPGLREEP